MFGLLFEVLALNVLLVPSLNFVAGRPEVYVPYGLLNLERAARDEGFFGVEVFCPSSDYWGMKFENSNSVVDSLLSEIDYQRYDGIGFSTVCSSVHYTLSVAEEIKRRRPSTKIFLGGPYGTKLASRVLKVFQYIDAVFVGEAERSFVAFLKNVRSGRRNPFLGVSGIASRGMLWTEGQVLEDLDELPQTESLASYLEWARLDLRLNAGKNFVPIEATRGCPLKCSFCSTKQVWGAKVRRKSAERLALDIQTIRKTLEVDLFSLIGDNVGVPRNKFLQFCRDVSGLNESFHWACSLKLDRFDCTDLELAWSAGCRGMFIGVETASSETLRLVNKAADLSRELLNIEKAIEMGFLVETSFIIGFPWETEADVKATFDLHCRFLALGAKRSQIGILSPIPGTEIVDNAELHWDISPGTFSDDGIPLSDRHVLMIEANRELFSHFARYVTPNVTIEALRAYQGAAAQMNGLHQRRRQRSAGSTFPFAGQESQLAHARKTLRADISNQMTRQA